LGGFPLPLEVAELVVHVVHLALQPLPLPLEPVPLGADLLESAPALVEIRSLLSVRWIHRSEEYDQRAECVSGEAGKRGRNNTPEDHLQQEMTSPLPRLPAVRLRHV
jgi:hypothetical protein